MGWSFFLGNNHINIISDYSTDDNLPLKHKDTPVLAKVIAVITIGYALSPIDLIPDFILVLGYLDDVILLPALVALTIKLIPAPIIEQCRLEAEEMWKDGKPKRWYYAIPVLLIWVLIIWLIVKGLIKYW